MGLKGLMVLLTNEGNPLLLISFGLSALQSLEKSNREQSLPSLIQFIYGSSYEPETPLEKKS